MCGRAQSIGLPAAGKPHMWTEKETRNRVGPAKKSHEGWKQVPMRSSKSRSRGKNRGANRSPANNINRVFDSSGPEGKVRGTPQQIIDKYTQLARDAFLGNDRVAGENFQQHAEHYTRLLSEAQRDAEEKRQQADQQNRERQAQKQREREEQRERDRAREAVQAQQPQAEISDQAADVVDLVETGSETDSGLVETPEEQPKRKQARGRKPRAKAPKPEGSGDADPAADADAPGTPEAPEAAAS